VAIILVDIYINGIILLVIILVDIGGYWWLLVAILLMAIGDYYNINYFLIFYVIIS